MKHKHLFSIITFFILLTITTACDALVVEESEQSLDLQNNDEEMNPAQVVELEQDRTSIRVLWTISDFVIGSQFDGDEADARAMIFEPLDIDEDYIIFLDKKCVDVVFEEASVDIAQFVSENWQETPQSLGIEDVEQGTVVSTNCSLFGFSEYLRLPDGRLFVPYNEVFYIFEPNVVY